MQRLDPRTFLFDIQSACELIVEFTSGMSFPDYAADPKTRSAVERQLEIIGEALGQMLKVYPEMGENFPEAPDIIAFRNRLIHGYASVSNSVVWGIVEGDLPDLKTKVDGLLAGETP